MVKEIVMPVVLFALLEGPILTWIPTYNLPLCVLALLSKNEVFEPGPLKSHLRLSSVRAPSHRADWRHIGSGEPIVS